MITYRFFYIYKKKADTCETSTEMLASQQMPLYQNNKTLKHMKIVLFQLCYYPSNICWTVIHLSILLHLSSSSGAYPSYHGAHSG